MTKFSCAKSRITLKSKKKQSLKQRNKHNYNIKSQTLRPPKGQKKFQQIITLTIFLLTTEKLTLRNSAVKTQLQPNLWLEQQKTNSFFNNCTYACTDRVVYYILQNRKHKSNILRQLREKKHKSTDRTTNWPKQKR